MPWSGESLDQLSQALGELGFSPYEARAYVALVARSPANGYEVAKTAAIPTSKIYETLKRLEQRGAARRFSASPVRYAATPPADLLAGLRHRFSRAADRAEQALKSISSTANPELTWVMEGGGNIANTLRQVVDRARTSLYAALWEGELEELAPALRAAGARGVEMHVASYGAMPAGLSGYDLSLCGISAEERLSGRRLCALVADARECVTAVIQPTDVVSGIWTENGVLALLVTEYIREEIMGRALINAMGESRYQELRIQDPTLQAMLRADDDPRRATMPAIPTAESSNP
jgi:HTH-type transcriptional regulator, sugar sensing transcriptional regulator